MTRNHDSAALPGCLAFTEESELGEVEAWRALESAIHSCASCPRLRHYRSKVAQEKVKRHADEAYWGKPVSGFGDPSARLFLLGLAPGAQGANRTGRMFTGDPSSDFLMKGLQEAGFANIPYSRSREDGLKVSDVWISSAVKCVPPANRPSAREFRLCSKWLKAELELLSEARVYLGIGRDGYLAFLKHFGLSIQDYPFAHGILHQFDRGWLIGSYHTSRYNVQTGRLNAQMLRELFEKVRKVLASLDQG